MTKREDLSIARELYVRNAELAVRNKTLSLLHKIDQTTLESLGEAEMAQRIARIFADEFRFWFVGIGIKTGQTVTWVGRSADNADVQSWLPRTKASVEKSMKTRQRQTLPEGFVFPLLYGKRTMGAFVIGLKRDNRELTEYERETIDGLLDLIVIAIDKAQTYEHLRITTAKLRAANRKLQELDSLKTEFLSIATHQLRTPLAVTKGYIAMLHDGMLGKLTLKQRQTVATVQQSNEQLIMLVNHLLDLTRIESGRLQVRLEPVSVHELVEWVVNFMKPRAKEKGIGIVLKGRTLSPVQADPEKLKEVIMNLVDNGIKYTEKGAVTVNVKQVENQVVVEVADTGYGLTPADREKMFEMFSTGSASKHVKTTSGVGLYVCRKLMEAMGGAITAESRGVGRGSTFTISLPMLQST